MKTASFPAVVEARKAATVQLSYYRTMMQAKKPAAPHQAQSKALASSAKKTK